MKSLLIIFFLTIFSFHSFSQIGLLSSSMFDLKEPLQVKASSGIALNIPFQMSLIKDSTKFKSSTIHFEPGFRFMRYKFKNKLIATSNANELQFNHDTDPNHIYNNNIFSNASTFQFNALSARIYYGHRLKKFKNLQICVGIHGQYIMGGSFLRKYKVSGDKVKIKDKFKNDSHYFHINRVQYGFLAGATYKWITFFGSYNLTSLVKPGKGQNIQMYHFGLFLNFFWKRIGLRNSRLFW